MKNKTGAGHPDGHQGRRSPAPVRSLNFSTPSRRLLRPRSPSRTASLPFLRLDNHAVPETRHHLRSFVAPIMPKKREAHLVAARCAASPSQLSRGRSRARPRAPCPWASALSPRARRAGACTPSRLRPPSGLRGLRCCHRTKFIFPRPGPGAARRAPPDRDGGDAAPVRAVALPPQRKKKNKSKKE